VSEQFRTIVADCPWKFDDKLPGKTRGAERNYRCLTLDELKHFPLPPIALDATLFFWRVASMQREALDVVDAWGFGPVKCELVWRKVTVGGARWFGMGRTVRAEHEICLIAKRGRPAVRSHSVRSTFDAICEGHSQKPDVFYRIVEQLCDGPFVELFARRQRPGWTCFGDELDIRLVEPESQEAGAKQGALHSF
jgi:N6-adenosine-specific RNA methylase IME4